jgi:hypothetical protein
MLPVWKPPPHGKPRGAACKVFTDLAGHRIFWNIRAQVRPKTLQQAALLRARDLAGGVSYLGRHLGIGAAALDAMLACTEEIPTWVFLRVVDYINDAEASGTTPPGFPANWQDMPDGKPPD